jgi:hypothetical protein
MLDDADYAAIGRACVRMATSVSFDSQDGYLLESPQPFRIPVTQSVAMDALREMGWQISYSADGEVAIRR